MVVPFSKNVIMHTLISNVRSLPAAAIGADGYCRRSMVPTRHGFRCLSVWLHVANDDVTPFFLIIPAIVPKFIGVMNRTMKQIAMWNGHARPILGSQRNFSMRGLARSEGKRFRFLSRISAIDLEFSEVMDNSMKADFSYKCAHSWSNVACSTEF